ncbi:MULTISPECIES: rhodanese-like domain-containing protein [unclassified Spirillospora]|uniref:MBL fold metallo-hydrolase n=1 Tax=unclassified Spirillospora TaxID=2642701 RepID=UPI003714D362
MFFQQFYLEGLGHASYLLGSEQTGEALVFDPRRDVEDYLAQARRQGLRIRYALDSHGHNDYLSGVTQLAVRTGAEVFGAATADLGYRHRPLRDGEQFEIGEIGIEVLHTPGHTPEHISLLVHDRDAGSDEPALLLSGGALLVGDLARPDLLGGRAEAEEAARALCATVQHKILSLPDHVEVFPTHVAGSLCGGSIGSRLSTTVGYERRTNARLADAGDTARFVENCLSLEDLPAVPPYWRRMRARNLAGVEPITLIEEPAALPVEQVKQARDDGAVVLDVRAPEAFGGGHVPGALNVGLGSSFATWAGTVLPEDARVLLVLDRPEDLWTVIWDLLRVGYEPPIGWLSGGMAAWRTAAEPLGRVPQITVHELRDRLRAGEVNLLDVRQPAEWSAGHAPGAAFITGADLPERLGEVPGGKPLAVTCGSGYRSSVAASLLAGHRDVPVLNVLGGMTAWTAAGFDLDRT